MKQDLKAFTAIFRLDYQPKSAYYDKIGAISDILSKKLELLKPLKISQSIDISESRMVYQIIVKQLEDQILEGMNFEFGLKSVNGSIDFVNGISIDKLRNNPYIQFISESLNLEEIGSKYNFERIGFRVKVLFDKLDNEIVLKFINSSQNNISLEYEKSNFKLNDAFVRMVYKEKDTTFIMTYGPFELENDKLLFNLEPAINSALMLDMDYSVSNVSLSDFNFQKYVSEGSRRMEQFAYGIVNLIQKGEINAD